MNPDTDQTWTTEELQRDFSVKGFLAPYVVVTRKADGVEGTLQFTHMPRLYFGWQPDVPSDAPGFDFPGADA